MSIQLFIGFTVEGTTDTRFLTQVIQNVFEETALDCRSDVVIEDVRLVDVPKTVFVDTMLIASRQAVCEYGISILCIHADSDSRSIENVIEYKFDPLTEALATLKESQYCKTIVPVIPIQMTEAWMLADKELLKLKIDARGVRDDDLGLHRAPESYADPKQAIEEAIRIAQSGKTRRRRYDLTIGDLYEELGQSIVLDKFRAIPSFNVFESNVRNAFRSLGYIE
jgi:hypothetical protein